MSANNKMGLTAKIMIGMIAGIVTGLLIQSLSLNTGFVQSFLVDGVFTVIGKIFVTTLKMMIVPLVFVSIVVGTCSLSDPSKLGRLGGKSIGLYLATTAIAIAIAIALALVVSPGVGVNMPSEASFAAKEAPGFGDVLVGLFPSNPLSAMVNGNMLQIIVFAVLFGIAISLSGESAEPVSRFFNAANEVNMKLVTLLMAVAPIGVFCLLAKLFSGLGLAAIMSLIKYFGVVVAALAVHALIVYPTLLKTLSGLSPVRFLQKMREPAMFAFSTASSSATVPVTLRTVSERMGVSRSVSAFTIPLGATINMDGTAIMQGVATVFIAQVFNVQLGLGDYLTVILTATLASIGTAGVPGAGLIMLSMVLAQVGLPVEGIALIIGVDRLLDMTRTAVNVTGDSMVTCVVAASEGELDRERFDSDFQPITELQDADVAPSTSAAMRS